MVDSILPYNRTYTVKARILPCIPLMIVLFVIYTVYSNENVSIISIYSLLLRLIPYSVIFFVSLFFNELNRYISKNIVEKRVFKNGTKWPTTNLMLFSDDTYLDSKKYKIRDKIRAKYHVELSSQSEETDDDKTARKRILEAVEYIKNDLRDNKLLFDRNVSYGFIRNLFGNLCASMIVLSISMFYFRIQYGNVNSSLIFVSIVYLILLVISYMMTLSKAKEYATMLYDQFIVLK